MPELTFIAFLRGINVGGNILKMDRLRSLCSDLGAKDVRTYVQSGNVAFTASGSAQQWTRRLEKKLSGESRLPISVIIRTAEELKSVRTKNPFLQEPNIEVALLGVAFLQEAPNPKGISALRAMDLGSERFRLAGREIYLHCPEGFGNAKLYSLDKILGQKTTVRNWNTVAKLCEMSAV
ncbi:MAG TPA: DUF1697 domain-containing protein [Candidatus Acidoferrales bacterium]